METKQLIDHAAATRDGSTSARRPALFRRWWTGFAVLGAVVALSLSVAQAHGPGGGPGPGGMFGGGFHPGHMQKLLEKVGASDSQKSQIRAIWEGLRPQLKGLREQHGQLHRQMAEAVTAPTINTAQVEKLRQQSVQLIDKTSVLVTQGFVASAQVLTPEQRKLALAEMEKRRHHGPRGGDGEE